MHGLGYFRFGPFVHFHKLFAHGDNSDGHAGFGVSVENLPDVKLLISVALVALFRSVFLLTCNSGVRFEEFGR